MDNLFLKKFDELANKASNIHSAIDIIQRKSKFNQELANLSADVGEIEELKNDVSEF